MCEVEGCSRKSRSRGWCNKHYKRWLRHGDPSFTKYAMSVTEAFSRYVLKDPDTGCWEWTGKITSLGYGRVRFRKGEWFAHRAAWTLVNGEIPEGLEVNHMCWNSSCVNVDHLNLATRSENTSYLQGPDSNNTSGFRNVQWSKQRECWMVELRVRGKRHYKFGFKTPEEASEYASLLREELLGEFAGRG